MRKKLIKELEKKFPGKEITLVLVEVGGSHEKETLIVDGQKIDFCWDPPVEHMKSKNFYKTLLEMCEKSIKENESRRIHKKDKKTKAASSEKEKEKSTDS